MSTSRTPLNFALDMKTSFVRPATGRLMATGKLLHGGRRMAFCEGSVHDETGALCARATGTFKFLTRLRRGDQIVTAGNS